jgi:pimeloyl-ACP methyl ester carboxylesterase
MGLVSISHSFAKYTIKGKGDAIIILPGGGEENPKDYRKLQSELAKDYKVVLIDIVGLIYGCHRSILLNEWSGIIDRLVKSILGGEKFFIVAHSFSCRIALLYLLSGMAGNCQGVIFLNPGFVNWWQSGFWHAAGLAVHIFGKPRGMRWLKDGDSFKTAWRIMTPFGKTRVKIPCLIMIGRKDPFRNFITGWKRLKDCEVRVYDWQHSSNKKNPGELAVEISKFIRQTRKAS